MLVRTAAQVNFIHMELEGYYRSIYLLFADLVKYDIHDWWRQTFQISNSSTKILFWGKQIFQKVLMGIRALSCNRDELQGLTGSVYTYGLTFQNKGVGVQSVQVDQPDGSLTYLDGFRTSKEWYTLSWMWRSFVVRRYTKLDISNAMAKIA